MGGMSSFWRPLGGHVRCCIYADHPPILSAWDRSGGDLTINGPSRDEISSEHLEFVRELAAALAEYVREYERWVQLAQDVSSFELAAVE